MFPPSRLGRPAKRNALSAAERTRRYRARRRALGLKPKVVWAPVERPEDLATYPSLDSLRETRRSARERDALAAAAEALRRLRSRGVRAGVFGSLATGRFGLHSDVDFIVLKCPAALRYRIETDVEACMQAIAFGAYACKWYAGRIHARMNSSHGARSDCRLLFGKREKET